MMLVGLDVIFSKDRVQSVGVLSVEGGDPMLFPFTKFCSCT